MASMEESLPSNNFFRVHKSYIVSVNKIDTIEKNRVYIGKHVIPISITYKESFSIFLGKRIYYILIFSNHLKYGIVGRLDFL